MLRYILFIFYFLVLINILSSIICSAENANDESGPLVVIDDGILLGKYMKTRYERKIMGFMSIPYAKPPINELRFKDPVPAEPWTGTYKAVNEVPECVQKILFATTVIGTEDCLYLNVYTPLLPVEGYIPLPVMVFVHRGGWVSGSSKSTLYSPSYLLDKNIILVTLNYRLGPLGFLSTEDDVVPGNMGLKDQVLALKWVQKNIGHFGGDPNNVTIFGRNAGSCSVQFHMLSSVSRGLYHRAISQSGSVFCTWTTLYDSPKKTAISLAKTLNCSTTSSEEMIKCMSKFNGQQIMKSTILLEKFLSHPLNLFVPVVEHDHPNAFLLESPRKIIMEGKMNSVTYIMGITNNDGSSKSEYLINHSDLLEQFSTNFDEYFPILVGTKGLNTKKIRQLYFDNKVIANDSAQQIVNIFTHSLFVSCIIESIHLQKKYGSGDLYLYYFDYESTQSAFNHTAYSLNKFGLKYIYDLFYLFPHSTLYDTDNEMVDIMTELWTSFATTGKPTLNNMDIWTPVISDNMNYLHIKNNKDIRMKMNLFKEESDLWICLLSKNCNENNIN